MTGEGEERTKGLWKLVAFFSSFKNAKKHLAHCICNHLIQKEIFFLVCVGTYYLFYFFVEGGVAIVCVVFIR